MFLLQMSGYPGSGKSTLSKEIAVMTNAIVIDRDIIKTSMINSKVPNEIIANASYNVVFDLAAFYLSMKKSVIIDTPCYYIDSINNGMRISNKYRVNYKYIECRVEDYSIIENRVNNRDRLLSHISTTSREQFMDALDKSVRPDDGNYILVDTSKEDSYNMNMIEKYLYK